MYKDEIIKLLEDFKANDIPIDSVIKKIESSSYEDIGFAKVDHSRLKRQGYPEVIYGESKTVDQIYEISKKLLEKGNNLLITRTTKEAFEKIKEFEPTAEYNELGRTIVVNKKNIEKSKNYIAIVAAGTSDLYVVEEAYETAKILGNEVVKVVDVGVAGIHRLFSHIDTIQNAKVVIVVAGMEGALASVVGGLVDKPVIAVPTSVGYGTSFGGVAALLSMLNCCSSGVSVVNIDNGFGAAYSASMINQL